MSNERTAEKIGDFTLPGEAGYESLTLRLAEKWGADVIRDSDGTALSDEILNSGYGIYSTICIIRDHNEWAKQNTDKIQQCFLMTPPKVAVDSEISFNLLETFFKEQFQVNESSNSLKYWQVFDRTTNQEVSREHWNYESGQVGIFNITPFHKYTVNFLAYRIWEEISMYNYTTNHWNKEHLLPIDPIYPEVQDYMLSWMNDWCASHKHTTVVRFTSLFYNFTWIWGNDERNRNLFTDWGSYDFAVSPFALDEFEKKYHYRLTSEDFINKGKLNVTHVPADKHKLDWMAFVNDFVISFGKKLVGVVHDYQKLAYVFYDDSWIGIEPYNGRFSEFGFDGIIKCAFSGFEARLCAGVDGVQTHEMRLHPYLFPIGLNGTPTFQNGGNPTEEAQKYWTQIRRALLREPVDRIGLGGYLHLTEAFPDFCDYIEKIANEFRSIKALHRSGKPYCVNPRVGILLSWGKLRSWTLSGHYHETYMHDLININESLSGLPVQVSFIGFDELEEQLKNVDVIINAGYAGSSWSGGEYWKDNALVEKLTRWVYNGGEFIGVNEPSAIAGYDTFFRMAHVLGIDEDIGDKVCHGKWDIQTISSPFPVDNVQIRKKENIYLIDEKTETLLQEGQVPKLTFRRFGKGQGIYLSSFFVNPANTRMLLDLILCSSETSLHQNYITDNINTEAAYFSGCKSLAVVNNSNKEQKVTVATEGKQISLLLEPYDMKIVNMD